MCASATTCGWAMAPACCAACASATTRSSARARSSPRTCRPTRSWPACRRRSCACGPPRGGCAGADCTNAQRNCAPSSGACAPTPGPLRVMRCRVQCLLTLAFLLAFAPSAHAAFSGANGQIAFDRDNHVLVMDPDGTDERTVATGTDPAWSPDGTKIAYQ